MSTTDEEGRFVTKVELVRELRRAGVTDGCLAMVHARMSSFGWVVGGVQTLVEALLEAVGPDGTLAAYAGWEDNPQHLETWSKNRRDTYRRGMPPYDPVVSEARRSYGRLPERIRTWPGARRSSHPEANLVALGARADWLTTDSPGCDGYGASSALARVAEGDGLVVMLGAPLHTLTLVHLAEGLARAEPKRRVRYVMPVLAEAGTVWCEFNDVDTSCGTYDYEQVLGPGRDYVEAVAQAAAEAEIGHTTTVCGAQTYIFPAAGLRDFAVAWLEQHYGD